MNECQSCGACCASLRVDFHPAELEGGNFAWGQGVPKSMVVAIKPAIMRMLGTDDALPRCIALEGEVGQSVSCSIYEVRPSPCREFETSHDACAKARKQHGLQPL